MTDDAKKFIEEVSKNEALKAELFEAFADDHAETAAKFAKAHGYDLTAEDFKGLKVNTVSEDELKAVAGGAGKKLVDDSESFIRRWRITDDSEKADSSYLCQSIQII